MASSIQTAAKEIVTPDNTSQPEETDCSAGDDPNTLMTSLLVSSVKVTGARAQRGQTEENDICQCEGACQHHNMQNGSHREMNGVDIVDQHGCGWTVDKDIYIKYPITAKQQELINLLGDVGLIKNEPELVHKASTEHLQQEAEGHANGVGSLGDELTATKKPVLHSQQQPEEVPSTTQASTPRSDPFAEATSSLPVDEGFAEGISSQYTQDTIVHECVDKSIQTDKAEEAINSSQASSFFAEASKEVNTPAAVLDAEVQRKCVISSKATELQAEHLEERISSSTVPRAKTETIEKTAETQTEGPKELEPNTGSWQAAPKLAWPQLGATNTFQTPEVNAEQSSHTAELMSEGTNVAGSPSQTPQPQKDVIKASLGARPKQSVSDRLLRKVGQAAPKNGRESSKGDNTMKLDGTLHGHLAKVKTNSPASGCPRADGDLSENHCIDQNDEQLKPADQEDNQFRKVLTYGHPAVRQKNIIGKKKRNVLKIQVQDNKHVKVKNDSEGNNLKEKLVKDGKQKSCTSSRDQGASASPKQVGLQNDRTNPPSLSTNDDAVDDIIVDNDGQNPAQCAMEHTQIGHISTAGRSGLLPPEYYSSPPPTSAPVTPAFSAILNQQKAANPVNRTPPHPAAAQTLPCNIGDQRPASQRPPNVHPSGAETMPILRPPDYFTQRELSSSQQTMVDIVSESTKAVRQNAETVDKVVDNIIAESRKTSGRPLP